MTPHRLWLLVLLAACAPADEAPVELRGMFTYLADAATFQDCASGRTLPVVPGWGADVERAYLESRPAPGRAVLATLTGRVAMRAPEPGLAERPHLEIVEFGRFWPEASCEAPPPR